MTLIFFSQIALSSDNVLNMYNMPLRWFFAELRGFEAKVFTKNVAKLRIFHILQIRLNLYLYGSFYVCFNIFTSTCRTSPIFLLTDSPEFRQCFKYVKHSSPMIFRWAEGLWSESFHQKSSQTQNFRHPQNPIEPLFSSFFYVCFNIFTSMCRTSPIFFTGR